MELAERIVERCRRRGARLVFETDDDLFHIPEDHPESQHYLRIAKAAKWLAKMADAVLTSTGALREQLLPLNANTIVAPNLLDERLWPLRSDAETFDPDEIRVLYAGTVSHRDDLEFLGRAVRKLSRHRREKVRIDVVGVTSQAAGWFQAIPVPGHIAASYPRFVQWLRAKNHWHWGVAPLLDTPFNRSKSALKFLEYSALGLASICSDVTVYREAVEAGRTGILVPNDPDRWRDALETALGDEALWTRLRANCRPVVSANSIGARAQELKSVWASLAPQVPQSTLQT
jgi:glycosyltransferase involved in cell wall biosynthesis